MGFTQNYINYMRHMFTYDPYYGTSEDKTVKTAAGTTITITPQYSYAAGFAGAMRWGRCQVIPTSYGSKASSCGYGVYFGSGNTAPTKDDYTLASPITSGLSVTNPSENVTFSQEGDGVYSAQASYLLTNTTSSDITIKEVGLFVAVGLGAGGQFYPVLAYRAVLSTPVTIPAGGAKTLDFKITFNQPS